MLEKGNTVTREAAAYWQVARAEKHLDTRVSVTTVDGRRWTGTITDVTNHDLVIDTGATSHEVVALAGVTSVQRI